MRFSSTRSMVIWCRLCRSDRSVGDFPEVEQIAGEASMPYVHPAGVEQEGGDHRNPVRRPATFNAGVRMTSRSYLILWPTFLIFGFSRMGLSAPERLSQSSMWHPAGPLDGDVIAGAVLPTEAHADELERDRIERSGFGVKGEARSVFSVRPGILRIFRRCLNQVIVAIVARWRVRGLAGPGDSASGFEFENSPSSKRRRE